MKPVFYNKLGYPVFDAYQPDGPKTLKVTCECNETYDIHVCHSACPKSLAQTYTGVGANNPDWQG